MANSIKFQMHVHINLQSYFWEYKLQYIYTFCEMIYV